MRTSWSRCSSLVLACLLALSLAAPAAAVSVADADVPTEAEVGTQVTATATLDRLYREPQLESWRLHGETALENVTWTVTYIDQTGAKTGQESFDGANFTSSQISTEKGISEVQVEIRGTVPEIEEYSYDPAQSFLVMSLSQTRQGGTSNAIDEWEARPYTPESQEARTAIEDASEAVEAAGNPADAEETLASAVDAYNGGNFDNAVRLAENARSRAEQAQQSQQTVRLALYGVGALLFIGLVGGGLYWYRSQQDTYDKLG